MTKNHQKYPLKIKAVFIAVFLLLSFASDSFHLLGHYNHTHCTETGTVHFHKKESDCSIFDFTLTPVIHIETLTFNKLKVTNYRILFLHYSGILKALVPDYYHRRGPPTLV